MEVLLLVMLYDFCLTVNENNISPPSTLAEFREISKKILCSDFIFPSSTVKKILSQMMLLYLNASPLFELYTIIDSDQMEDPHINIVGDLHGCFKSLDIIFTKSGLPSSTNPYIILGDFLDRGENAIEVFMILCMYKLKFPKYFHILMGNHESTNHLQVRYGTFKLLQKYSDSKELFEAFQCLFMLFPIAGTLFPVYSMENNSALKRNINSGGVFLAHGGIPITKDLNLRNEFSLNVNSIGNLNSYGVIWNENANLLNEEKIEHYMKNSFNAINTFLSDENNISTFLFSRFENDKKREKVKVSKSSLGFLFCIFLIFMVYIYL
jgi:hypothetical protein